MNELLKLLLNLFIAFILYKGIKQIIFDILYFINKYKSKNLTTNNAKKKRQYDSYLKDNQKANELKKELPLKSDDEKFKIIGIGGGGCNIADYLGVYNESLYDVLLINSDKKALDSKKNKKKIYLGKKDSFGCGGNPSCGLKLIDNRFITELRNFIFEKKEVYIIITLGGGVGSRASKPIVKYLVESKIKTNLILVRPFSWEGAKKQIITSDTLSYMQKYTKDIYILKNDDLIKKYSKLSVCESFLMMNKLVNDIIQGNLNNC